MANLIQNTNWEGSVDQAIGSTQTYTFNTAGTYSDRSINFTVNVPGQAQADWDQTNTTSSDYIKNKPSVPTVYTGSETPAASLGNIGDIYIQV